ncbi:MAG: M14 family metallopeptidase [Methylohalobius sp.]|nr:M14 family metallopeptidase [Methylohalobius sp.]
MEDLTLHRIESIPERLLDIDARDLHTLLPDPTLLYREGKEPRPLFVSVLLHGDEITGLLAVQRLLKKYRTHPLPRSLAIFFGNIKAAQFGVRRLDSQPDYNRVWPGGDQADCPEAKLMQKVWQIMAERGVFASVDIHNNSGRNPHYACINSLDLRFLNFARLFGRLVVYFRRPLGVQSMAFAQLCPAVTLECGRPGTELGIRHAFDFLDTCLHLTAIPNKPLSSHALDLFHTVAQVKIRPGIRFSFKSDEAELILREDLDRLNFVELPAGVGWGQTCSNALPLLAVDEEGNEVSERYFAVDRGRLVLTRKLMPSMLTLDERIIRQDCLGYLMERLESWSG